MILFTLQCEHDHRFESSFKSSEDYERLCELGLIECAMCGSKAVRKSVMAPSILSAKRRGGETLAGAGKAEAASNPAIAHGPELVESAHEMARKLRERLNSAKNVGWQFASEARAIHYGEKEEAPIYGRAQPDEVKELLGEGIAVAPLPFDPGAQGN